MRPHARRCSTNACTAWPRCSEPNTPPKLGATEGGGPPRELHTVAWAPAAVDATCRRKIAKERKAARKQMKKAEKVLARAEKKFATIAKKDDEMTMA